MWQRYNNSWNNKGFISNLLQNAFLGSIRAIV